MDYYGVSNKNALEYIIDREDKKVKILSKKLEKVCYYENKDQGY